MLEKTFYKSLLSHSFNIPVKIIFWDGSSVVYGDGEPEVTVKFKERSRFVTSRRTPQLHLVKPTWMARSKSRVASKN